MLLSEILKKSNVPYDLVRTSPDFLYTFHTPSMSIDVHIIPKKWPSSEQVANALLRKIKNNQDLEDANMADLKQKYGGMYEVTFQPAGSDYFGMTNTHEDMIKIMSAVIQIVKDFVSTHKTAELMFVANKKEKGRVKLYNRIVQTMPQSNNFTLVDKVDTGDRIHYMLANTDLV